MNEVRQWLITLGLDQYAAVFEEHAIEPDLLGDLTDADLRTIGVAALGHRKRILRAIATGEIKGGAETANPASSSPSLEPPATAGIAERRQLTVMFGDLVGSTELSQALDPEKLRDLNRLYQDASRSSIERFGGYVARYMGDGVLAYFGYPTAHEDDAERAVRAGLDLAERVSGLSTTPPLAVRIGIATGPVVVGDLIGEGASQESAVVGQTPNLAARLQGVSSPNTVTISDATHSLVAGLFECLDLGVRPLKGFTAEQRLWRATGEGLVASRFEALRSQQRSSFVGRDGEVSLLLNRWESAVAGEGQVLHVEGEAGIGKSRLADELRRALASGSYIPVHYQCSPHHTNSAFFPLVQQLTSGSAMRLEDSAEERLDKLERHLPTTMPLRQEALWLFANLLSLPTDRYPTLDLEPQELKSKTIAAFRNHLTTMCKDRPVLVIFEDTHWIDPTTLEVLAALVQSGEDLPVLFVITHRPGFEPPWSALGFVSKVQLSRLPRRAGAVIIRDVAGGKSIPKAVIQQILEKTDGVALFVEELTKTVLEGGLLREEAGGYVLDRPVPEFAIPSTLRDSLVARLDRLGTAKEVAQIAACIGREFTYRLLRAVVELSEPELRVALDVLTDSELLYRRGTPPDSLFTFKHALVQDAAFQTLLLTTRKHYHGRIAGALQEHFPETVSSQPELVAHHCTEAGLFESAASHWRTAGTLALSRRANREAVWCFEQSIAALTHLPETRSNVEMAIDLRFHLRNALFTLGELSRTLDYLREAEPLAEKLGDEPRLTRVRAYLAQTIWSTGDYARAGAVAHRALAAAQTAGDPTSCVSLHFTLHQIYYSIGDYPRAIGFARRNVETLEGDLVLKHFGMVGLPAVMGRTWLAWSLAEQGHFNEAASVAESGLQIAEGYDHPFTTALALWGSARVYALGVRRDEVLDQLERAVELCRRWDFRLLLPWTATSLGQVYARSGRPAEALALLEEAVPIAAALPGAGFHSFAVLTLGDIHRLAGRSETARHHVQQALSVARARKERGHEAWSLYVLGRIAADPGAVDDAAAEGFYAEARALADELGMRPLSARCQLGLGKLIDRADRPEKARELLGAAAALFQAMGKAPPRSVQTG